MGEESELRLIVEGGGRKSRVRELGSAKWPAFEKTSSNTCGMRVVRVEETFVQIQLPLHTQGGRKGAVETISS